MLLYGGRLAIGNSFFSESAEDHHLRVLHPVKAKKKELETGSNSCY
jgi:hypothetical protein